jgi:hypothetical protein
MAALDEQGQLSTRVQVTQVKTLRAERAYWVAVAEEAEAVQARLEPPFRAREATFYEEHTQLEAAMYAHQRSFETAKAELARATATARTVRGRKVKDVDERLEQLLAGPPEPVKTAPPVVIQGVGA